MSTEYKRGLIDAEFALSHKKLAEQQLSRLQEMHDGCARILAAAEIFQEPYVALLAFAREHWPNSSTSHYATHGNINLMEAPDYSVALPVLRYAAKLGFRSCYKEPTISKESGFISWNRNIEGLWQGLQYSFDIEISVHFASACTPRVVGTKVVELVEYDCAPDLFPGAQS